MSDTYQPRDYCTQPRPIGQGCDSCSLASYGRDCRNNPIERIPKETQAEVDARFRAMIPDGLQERFKHLSYAEMAERHECQAYADELRELERDWWAAEEHGRG